MYNRNLDLLPNGMIMPHGLLIDLFPQHILFLEIITNQYLISKVAKYF